MAFYPDSQTVCTVMTDLFQRTLADPQAQQEMRRAGIVFRIDISGPPATLVLDSRARPPQFFCGADSRRTDLVIHTPMDVMHQVWLGQIKLSDAFFSGRIKLDGSLLRALSLGGLFRRVEALYPGVLRDHGLLQNKT